MQPDWLLPQEEAVNEVTEDKEGQPCIQEQPVPIGDIDQQPQLDVQIAAAPEDHNREEEVVPR